MWLKLNRWIAWKLYPRVARLRASKLKAIYRNRSVLVEKVYAMDAIKYKKYGIKKKDIAKVI